MNWTELLTGEIHGTYAATEGLLGLVEDATLGWKPDSGGNWMTVGQLLAHLPTACGLCCKGFVTGDWGMPDGQKIEDMPPESMLPPAEKMPSVESVAQAREQLAADKSVALEMVAQAGEERLANEKIAAPWAPGFEQELGHQLLGMVGHLDTHKAQLFYYLKLQGVEVNTHHLYGMGGGEA
jgi:hypothetical protein